MKVAVTLRNLAVSVVVLVLVSVIELLVADVTVFVVPVVLDTVAEDPVLDVVDEVSVIVLTVVPVVVLVVVLRAQTQPWCASIRYGLYPVPLYCAEYSGGARARRLRLRPPPPILQPIHPIIASAAAWSSSASCGHPLQN
jgi:hypothetical protein